MFRAKTVRQSAIGDGSNVTGANGTAIGTSSQVTAINSVALGANSVADADNTVSVGSPRVSVRLPKKRLGLGCEKYG
jgi:autotransporter adhesin